MQAYNLFCEEVTPEFIEELLGNLDKLTVAEIEMIKLFSVATKTGKPPTTCDFIKARDVIGF